ncbi:beta-L-arabinofuranosidase domain-containing protein [Flavobacteriaceae bacterium SZ-1-7]|uniref:beta-L-arabinofuranosidase domain-containing protein n=1 Tax=Tamlana sedimenti TaxID=3134126 RepID=UPI00312858DB
MKQHILFYISVFCITNVLHAQLTVNYKQNEIPINSFKKITGYIGERIDANTEMSIKAFDIEKFTSMVEEKTHRDWWWIGEQPGKWLESAVLASTYSNDSTLFSKAKQILDRFKIAQEPDGYLGISDPAILSPQKPLRGMDPYELYFMLHALITAGQQWDDTEALETATGLADYFVKHINEGKAEFWPTNLRPPENHHAIAQGTSEIAGHSVHYSLEGTLLIDPVLRLYEITGDHKYLNWAKWVVNNIDKWSGWDTYSRLDLVADGKMGIDEVQPYVHSHTFQMNFLGLLRLYQITGDSNILKKVKGVWDDVYSRQMYITGGVSVGEHYEKNFIKPLTGNVVETCATMSWMQLTQQLLLLTGNPKYADNIERLLFNHVFASQAFDGDCYRYHTPPNGVKPYEYFHGPDCCSSSGTRIVSMLPLFFYAVSDKAIYINQYVANEAEIELSDNHVVKLGLKTDYPEEETIQISPVLDKSLSFTLNLRIPEWCIHPEISVNDVKIKNISSGTYAKINRKWKTSDVVKIKFPMPLNWIEHENFSKITISRLPGGELIFNEDKSNKASAPYALTRGPIVYAVDDLWWQGKSKPIYVADEVAYVRKSTSELKPKELPEHLLGPAYEVKVKTVTGDQLKTYAIPFTNVGLWYKFDEPKPDKHSKSYSYAIWLQDYKSEDFKLQTEKYNNLMKEYINALDYIILGYNESEKSHSLDGEMVSRGTFNQKNYIDAGNYISFIMNVSTSKPSQLALTYWGSDEARTFDIFANDQMIGKETLNKNKPNEFFEVVYDIPFELVKDKTDAFGQKVKTVTIKIKAKPGSIAGGVFGIKTIESTD